MARLTTVVVLPTPPFWFAQAIVWRTQCATRVTVTKVNSTIERPSSSYGRLDEAKANEPREIIAETARVYIGAFERITGDGFAVSEPDRPVLDRIRANLRRYF